MAFGGSIRSGFGAAAGGSLGTLFVRLAADSTDLDSKMDSAGKKVSSTSANIVKSLALISGAIAGLAFISVREANRFETSFAGVRKTINATEEEFKQLEGAFRSMAKQMPINVNELNNIAAAAGQLGIKTENLKEFTRVMALLGVTTNLSSDQAATQLARFANITGMSQKNFDKLGSTIVALGNKSATTESEISSMALRIAGAGSEIGLNEHQILGFAAALSSVGIEAEAGGTAMSQAMVKMAKAVKQGGDELDSFAAGAGLTMGDFTNLFEKDAAGAIEKFLTGMRSIKDQGGDVFTFMERMNLDGARMTDVITRAGRAHALFGQSLRNAKDGWESNNALTKEADQRFNTFDSQLEITKNLFRDLFISIGQQMVPGLKNLNTEFQDSMKSSDGWASSLITLSKDVIPIFVASLKTIGTALGGLKTGWDWFKDSAVGKGIAEASYRLGYESLTLQEKIQHGPFQSMGRTIGNPFDPIDKGGLGLPPNSAPSRASLMTGQTQFHPGHVDSVLSDQIKKSTGLLMEMGQALAGPQVGLNQQVMDATAGLRELAKAMEQSAEADGNWRGMMKINSDKVKGFLSDIGFPDNRRNEITSKNGQLDIQSKSIAMSKTQMAMGSVGGGILGQDQNVMQALELKREMELNEDHLKDLQKIKDLKIAMNDDEKAKLLQAEEMYGNQLKAMRMAQVLMELTTTSKMFDDLSNIAKAWGGEQSAAYKAMFAVSKAFAIADATVKIAQGIAGAFSLPWPANLAAAASVVAATSSIVSNIQSVELAFGEGKAKGGNVFPNTIYPVGEKGPELFVPRSAGTILPNDFLQKGRGETQVVINNYTSARATVRERQQGDKRVTEVMIKEIEDRIASNIRDGRGNVPKSIEQTYKARRQG